MQSVKPQRPIANQLEEKVRLAERAVNSLLRGVKPEREAKVFLARLEEMPADIQLAQTKESEAEYELHEALNHREAAEEALKQAKAEREANVGRIVAESLNESGPKP